MGRLERPVGRQPTGSLACRLKRIYDKCVSHDPAKRKKNQRKHNIDLAECGAVFDSPMLTREDAREEYGEERLVSLGWLKGRVVVLVWLERDDEARVISCREAEPHEQEAYFRAYPQGRRALRRERQGCCEVVLGRSDCPPRSGRTAGQAWTAQES